MTFMLVVYEYFLSEDLVFRMDSPYLRGDDGIIAEVRVVIVTFLEEAIFLCDIVDREEVSEFGLFEVGLFVLFFLPVVAVIAILF